MVWDYNRANVEGKKNPLSQIIGKSYSIIKVLQVSTFNETLTNIFSNFTPNKLVTFDDSDPLG